MNHVDKCLQKASEYEKQGNKEKAQQFFNLAERFEKGFKRIRELEAKIEIQKKTGGRYND